MSLIDLAGPGSPTYKTIRGDEQRSLIQQAQGGNRDAMETLCVAHDKFIMNTAYPYLHLVHDPDEILQVARVGFIEGVRRFDLSLGFALTTYTTWWIKHEIHVHVGDNEQDVSVPRNVAASFYTKKKVTLAAQNAMKGILRLDAPIKNGDSEDTTYGDLIVDTMDAPDAIAADTEAKTERKRLIASALCLLSPRQRLVIQRRFLDDPIATLETISLQLGVVRERVRQIEAKALSIIQAFLRRSVKPEDAESLWGGDVAKQRRRPTTSLTQTRTPVPCD